MAIDMVEPAAQGGKVLFSAWSYGECYPNQGVRYIGHPGVTNRALIGRKGKVKRVDWPKDGRPSIYPVIVAFEGKLYPQGLDGEPCSADELEIVL